MSNFQPLEVVDRGSETLPEVVENLFEINKRYKGASLLSCLEYFSD